MIMEILFVLGTKAQFIKTIPMINLAIEKKLNEVAQEMAVARADLRAALQRRR